MIQFNSCMHKDMLMVDEAFVRKDFEALAQYTKTPFFAYNDIHNENVPTASRYDYSRIISELSKLNGWSEIDTIKKLMDIDVLKYLSDGEFAVNVETSTRNGGGINCSGVVLFVYDYSDSATTYHEYAHSLQKITNVFDTDTVKKMYDNVGENYDETRQSEIGDYVSYLNEMHSEAFAYSVLLLRAKDTTEFLEIAKQSLDYAMAQTEIGNKEKDTRYASEGASSKYYASYPVMKKTIEQILKIRATKKQQKYFDENGVINFLEINDLAKQIVADSAYSPKQFNMFKKHSLNISYTKRGIVPIDHNHKTDVFYARIYNRLRKLSSKKGSNKVVIAPDHRKIIEDSVLRYRETLCGPVDTTLPDNMLALQSLDRIHGGISMLYQKTFLKDNTEEILKTIVAKRYRQKDFSLSSRKKDIELARDLIGFKRTDNLELLNTFFEVTDRILQKNLGNEYFEKMMSYSDYSLYDQRDIKDVLAYNPDNLGYAGDIRCETPLFFQSDVKEAQMYIDAGFDVNVKNDKGYTPLMTCKTGDVAKLYLENGADYDAQDDMGRCALSYVNAAVAEEIFKYNPNVEIRDNEGKTPIYYCKYAKKAKLFVENSADLNTRDNNGRTVFMYPMNSHVMKEFLKGKPDLNMVDGYGQSALFYQDKPESVALLIKARIDINIQNNYGNSVLMDADKPEIIEEILKGKPDLSLKNNRGENALMVNITYGKTKLLLDAGMNPNETDGMRKNAVMHLLADTRTSVQEKIKLIDMMFDKGLDKNATDINGENAIVYATWCMASRKDVQTLVEKLIVKGVDPQQAMKVMTLDENKQIVLDAMASVETRAKKLEKIRGKLAHAIDKADDKLGNPIKKITGKSVAEVKLPTFMEKIERKLSLRIFSK